MVYARTPRRIQQRHFRKMTPILENWNEIRTNCSLVTVDGVTVRRKTCKNINQADIEILHSVSALQEIVIQYVGYCSIFVSYAAFFRKKFNINDIVFTLVTVYGTNLLKEVMNGVQNGANSQSIVIRLNTYLIEEYILNGAS